MGATDNARRGLSCHVSGVLKEGFDFADPPMIFECNDMCGCNVLSCNNRVVQHGITYRMQVYKTYGMGWGVKSLVDIAKGRHTGCQGEDLSLAFQVDLCASM